LLGGWFQVTLSGIATGVRYRFVLPDGQTVPDPASHFQPADVHGPSELIDTRAYRWSDESWRARPWHEAIIYELHVGSFSPAGTFRGAIEKLSHLVGLGVTAIELMPIAAFPGRRNWGYDGAFPYAPDASYGRPEELKALVDAAHRAGMMVLLDVVYNHFGPEGNYLQSYANPFFTDRHNTPWGAAINFDGADSPAVRAFFIQNALYWLEEFHFDGLRLDAVHAIVHEGGRHFLDELAYEVRARVSGRHVHLILENEENTVAWLERDEEGKVSKYSAQWNDDVHHVLHTFATGEGHAYYQDYLDDTDKLGCALAEGFAFQGRGNELSWTGARDALVAPATRVFRRVHPESRSDWKSCLRRAAQPTGAASSGASARGRVSAAAADSHVVHGRGMGIAATVPFLL
jgi:malto-oligosyltrehalose trehalohydrolase